MHLTRNDRACDRQKPWPGSLRSRAYRGRRLPDGTWRIDVRDSGRSSTVLAAGAPALAGALLNDAFEGHRIREDLVDAFAAWLPARDFSLRAEFVAAWGLHWALQREQ
jgi:hypothetical protein